MIGLQLNCSNRTMLVTRLRLGGGHSPYGDR